MSDEIQPHDNQPDEHVLEENRMKDLYDFGPPDVAREIKAAYGFTWSRLLLAMLGLGGLVFVVIFIFTMLFQPTDSLSGAFGEGLGSQMVFGKNQAVYYSSDIDEAEARRLGEFLIIAGFFAGDNRVDVYVYRGGEKYIVCFFARWPDTGTLESLARLRDELAMGVFHDKPVEVHLCDPKIGTFAGEVQFQVHHKFTAKK